MKERNEREKDHAVTVEKLNNQIAKYEQEVESLAADIEKIKNDNDTLRASMSGDNSILQEQLEAMKHKYNEADQRASDVHNEYDRERALWEGKFKFIESLHHSTINRCLEFYANSEMEHLKSENRFN